MRTMLALLLAVNAACAQEAAKSARMTTLKDAVRAGKSGAVAEFLSDVKAKGGTPLVEPIPGEKFEVHATFLWAGSVGTRSVLIDWYPFTISRAAELSMERLEGTNLWYRTLRVPVDARFLYQLGENGRSRLGPDPLNPRRDVAEMPEASPQPYLARREGVARITMAREKIASRILGEGRPVLIYTPPGIKKGERLPTMVLFDGEQEDGMVFGAATIENLIHERKIPPILVARVPNLSGQARMRDLGCRAEFTQFLAKELMPMLEAKYGASRRASETGVGGVSRGGLAAVCAALHAPERFGLAMSQSGSLWYVPRTPNRKPYREPGWIIGQFLERPRLPVKFYLDVGKFEFDATGEGFGTLEPARRLRDVLRAKGYNVTYQELMSGHDDITWRGTLADGLIALFGTQHHR